jgi:amino acid permease
MTIWTFLYVIGCGVALIMSCFGLSKVHRELPEEQKSIGGLVCSCIISSLLSWAVPIWWIGNEVYNKLRRK